MKSMKVVKIVKRYRRQQGAALVMTLLFLLIMTALGLASMQTTAQQERMSGALRDQVRALQAAEAALRDAEALLSQAVLPPFDGSVAGLFSITAPRGQMPDWGHSQRGMLTASDAPGMQRRNSLTLGEGGLDDALIEGLAQPPEYFIQRLRPVAVSDSALEVGVAELEQDVYRVTARAFGANPNTMVVLETTFRR